jgi:hypothetical protein
MAGPSAAVFEWNRSAAQRFSVQQERTVFIVQAKPRQPDGILKAIKATRAEALQAANDFLNQGMPFVTVIADSRVYTVEQFALTLVDRVDD